jgi:tetratricopeptide (TPR) repeat protein
VRRGGQEIGRIVETATTSLEGDLLAIVEGRAPLPKFGAEALVYRLVLDHSGEEAETALRSAGPEILKLGDPDSLWHYAEFDLLKNNRAHEARAVIELYLQVEPKSARGHVILSDALLALGHKDEALAAVQKALALEPENKRALRAAEALRRP